MQFVYRYPKEKAGVLLKWKTNWQAVIDRFPLCAPDIRAAVDLWALQYDTASVFQFMRVLEVGLKELSEDLNVNFTVQTWHVVLNEIEKAIKSERETLPRGASKNERLQFLSEAAKEFAHFKDGWRNYVSHNKVDYDTHQARSVMEHVRVFMTTLALNLPKNVSEVSDQELDKTIENPHLHQAPEQSQ